MTIREIRLSTTPTPEAIAELRLGDVVYLDGLMYTAREGVYMRALEDRANIRDRSGRQYRVRTLTNRIRLVGTQQTKCRKQARVRRHDYAFHMNHVGQGR